MFVVCKTVATQHQIESKLHSLTTGRRSVGPSIRRIDTIGSVLFLCRVRIDDDSGERVDDDGTG